MNPRRLLVALLLVGGCSAGASADEPVEALRRDWRSLLQQGDRSYQFEGYPFLDCFREASEASRLPLPLLLGVASGESAFDPEARSHKDAIGIMQIRWPRTARMLGFESIEQLTDPCRNIDAGARYLRKLLDGVGGDVVLALASYNHGPGAIAGKDRNMNRHARWYVRYIHDKTQAVLAGRMRGTGQAWLRLGTFTDYGMARISQDHYRRIALLRESVELELQIQRNSTERYELLVQCSSTRTVDDEWKRYERLTGFRPDGSGR